MDPASSVLLDPTSDDMLWSMLDYAVLANPVREESQSPGFGLSSPPFPTSWPFETSPGVTTESEANEGPAMIFDPQIPAVRLHQLEYLLGTNSSGSSFL